MMLRETRQAMYVKRNIEARSYNHCGSGKTVGITYYECVCVYCSPSYTTCNAHAPYCHLWPTPLYNIIPHYLINGANFRKKTKKHEHVF
jgi:hypothetical protein